ncbi:anti-sigma factor antagonist [Candidatus Riflebacteria bacterium]
MSPFDCEIQDGNDYFYVSIAGSLDSRTRENFRYKMESIIKKPINSRNVIVDCEKLSFIDSSGLGMLLSIYRDYLKHSLDLHLIKVPEKIAELLNITQINKYVQVHNNLNDVFQPLIEQSEENLEKDVKANLLTEFEFSIPLQKGVTRVTSRYILDLLSLDYKISDDEYNKMSLAIDESINNALEHGYKRSSETNKATGNLKIFTFCYSDRIIIAVEDHGVGFNQEEIKNHLNSVLERKNFSWRGRGIYLINKLVDEVFFDSKLDTGSVFFLMKFLDRIHK